MMKRLIGLMVLMVALLAAVPVVLAGGWAVVVLDELPGEVHAGESQSIGFMVLQHGKTPVHNLGADEWPVEPFLEATNATTGETVRVEAVPTEEVGHFVAEITFPSQGEWTWSITPMPFNTSTQVFEPLSVLPALPEAGMLALIAGDIGTSAAADGSLVALARWVGLAAVTIGLAAIAWQRLRSTPKPEPQTER